jgi:hypothetical protein
VSISSLLFSNGVKLPTWLLDLQLCSNVGGNDRGLSQGKQIVCRL